MAKLTQVTSEPQSSNEGAGAAPEMRYAPSFRARAVVLMAILASFLWAAASVAAVLLIAQRQPLEALTLNGVAALAAGIAAPLTAIWLAALVLARSGDDRVALGRMAAAEARVGQVAARTRRELDAIEGVLGAIAVRVDNLGAGIGTQSAALMDSAGELERRSASVSSALSRDRESIETMLERIAAGSAAARAEVMIITAALPEADVLAASLMARMTAAGDDSRRQVSQLAELLAAVDSATADVRQRVEAATVALAERAQLLVTAGDAASGRLAAQGDSLAATVEAAYARTEHSLHALAAAVAEQRAAIDTAAEGARTVFTDLGRTAAVDVEGRVRESAELLAQLVLATQEVDTRTASMLDKMERGIGVVQAKLGNAADTTGAALGDVEARIGDVQARIHDMGAPLGEAQSLTRAVESAVIDLREAVTQSIDTLGTALPDSVARTGEAVDTLRRLLVVMSGEIGRVEAAAGAMTQPVEQGRATLDAAAQALEARRIALEATVSGITTQLASARGAVADIETGADAAALTATSKLVEALSRVRDVSAQAQGMMRKALDGAVEEARVALTAASGEAMRSAFLAPVERQLADIAEAGDRTAAAGQLSAERLTRQLLSLAETAGAVEARIAAGESALDGAIRADLARNADLLLSSLNSAAIDLAKPLGTEVTDAAWAAYLRGDKSIFSRRAVRLLDRQTVRDISAIYQNDREFREAASRYVHDFELLMKQTGAERPDNALSVALLGSDTGKLYVGLAQALEKFRT